MALPDKGSKGYISRELQEEQGRYLLRVLKARSWGDGFP